MGRNSLACQAEAEPIRMMLAQWVIDDDRLAAGDRLDRMSCVGWNDSDEAGPDALGHAVDRDLQFAFDDLPHTSS